jgi:CDP-glycerol glycerophosphotransferase (TagB/SpsB family)
MLKNSFIFGLKLLFNLAGLVLYPKTSGVLFHGYMGGMQGNTLALYNYMLKDKNISHDLWWTGKNEICEMPNDLKFRATPERKDPLVEHLRFLFFLMKFKVIICESAGDLSLYMPLIPSRSRLRVLLIHGFCLKACGVLSPAMSDKQREIWSKVGETFDLFSVSSRLEQYMLSSTFNGPVENFVIMGPQRAKGALACDPSARARSRDLIRSLYDIDILDKDQVIFYAPTHRDHESGNKRLGLFGFDDLTKLNEILCNMQSYLFVREHASAHPDSSPGMLSNVIYTNQYPNIDFSALAPSIDGLITDYSGIFLEYLDSDMRLAFWHYDITEYRINRGFSISEDIFKTGKIISDEQTFCAFINDRICSSGEITYRELWHSLLYEHKTDECLKLTSDEIKLRGGL